MQAKEKDEKEKKVRETLSAKVKGIYQGSDT